MGKGRGDGRRGIHKVFFHLQHLGNHAEDVQMDAISQEKVPQLYNLVESGRVQARCGSGVSLISALKSFRAWTDGGVPAQKVMTATEQSFIVVSSKS